MHVLCAQALWDTLLQGGVPHGAAEQVCGQVLLPGILCRASLRDALAYHGTQLGQAEVEAASFEALRASMEAAVVAIHRRWGGLGGGVQVPVVGKDRRVGWEGGAGSREDGRAHGDLYVWQYGTGLQVGGPSV